MAGILENIRKTLKNGSGKKYGFSGGTVFFLFFNLVLIIGFCKVSFYVLKNHRSAVDRDSLIKTYVDVQPYHSNKKVASGYIPLNSFNKEAPAPFFVKDASVSESADNRNLNPEKGNIPLPILQKTEERREVELAVTMKRPPVIRLKAEKNIENQAKTESVSVISENSGTDLEAIPIEGLMKTGISLLEESDAALASSELLLQEEEVLALNDTVLQQEEVAPPVVVEKKTVSVPEEKPSSLKQASLKTEKKKDDNGTHWVDVAELRRQLSLSVKENIERQNSALLEMNGAKQVASLDVKTDSDIAENKDGDKKESAPSLSASEKSADSSVEEKQVAVVQDIPFAGTSDAEKSLKKQKEAISIKNRSNIAGDASSLWKVAKSKGKPRNSLAVKNEEAESEIKTALVSEAEVKDSSKEQISKELPKTGRPDVIYRNGRAVEIVSNKEKKSLNWLDRQEAAVWTSMSQSDAPSVWSSVAESEDPDRAKAFRVADEQSVPVAKEQEKNVINSAPVRVVGEEVKPEAKENPLLLPLGAQGANKTEKESVPQAPKNVEPVSSAPLSDAGKNNGFSLNFPSTTQVKENSQGSNEGLMSKLFSFFGKEGASDELPNLGSGTPLKTETDKNEEQKPKNQVVNEIKKNEKILKAAELSNENKRIIPSELRLTFKPNSTEMSSQSIKWIKAFGQRAKKDIQNAVEVRMSNTDPALQQKRFLMIRNTLLGAGMNDVQILPVMTDRTPHTIVLRTIVLPEEGYTEYTTESNGVKERLYYKQW